MASQLTDVKEVAVLLRGLCGDLVQVDVHPAGDPAGFPIASFSGRLDCIAEEEQPLGECMHIRFLNVDGGPTPPTITIEPDRFVKAELLSTDWEQDLLYPPGPGDEERVFLNIKTIDAAVDLMVWI